MGEEVSGILMTGEEEFFALYAEGIFKLRKEDVSTGGFFEIRHEEAVVLSGMAIQDGAGCVASPAISLKPL